MSLELTQGAISTIMASDGPPSVQNPVLQVIHIKKISSVSKDTGKLSDRWRIILSDGSHFVQGMLGTQLQYIVETEEVIHNSVISLTQYVANTIQKRKLIIILGLEVLEREIPDRIGAPVSLDGLLGGAVSIQADNNAPAPVNRARPAANVGRSGGGPSAPIYPIEGLSPYQNKWTIKARVTSKSEIKHWSNQRGDGKLFSVNLLDETGEIRATGFNDAVDNFYNLLEENKVYFISKARVNIAKKQFSNLSNEYEITFENGTEIELCPDQDSAPQVRFNFTDIAGLQNVEKDMTTDVLAVVKDVGEVTQITSKATQRPVSKRDITLVDRSEMSVRLTLWGKQAESFHAEDSPVMAFKGVKVGDFGGRSLSMYASSTMMTNPDIPEAHALRGWYDAQGSMQDFRPYNSSMAAAGGADGGARKNEARTLAEVKDSNMGTGDKPDFFNSRATIIFVKSENLYYPACPSETCNKKVTDEGDGWRCEKCDRVYPAPEYRYIVALNAADHTGQLWLSGFNDVGQQLFGMSATKLHELKENDESAFQAAVHRANNQMFTFFCRAKQDNFNDTVRVRYNINRATPVNFTQAGNELLELIKQYS